MHLYIDFETEVGPKLTLSKMPLRAYLAQANLLTVAIAVDNADVTVYDLTSPVEYPLARSLIYQYIEQGATVVAHNASFDVRVLCIKMCVPWPKTVHCTMELAQAWSPNQPGGYSLDNLSRIWLPQHQRKAAINLAKCTTAELMEYNKQDVVACRALHKIAMAHLPPAELEIHELTQSIKELTFVIDGAKVDAAVTAFGEQANAEAAKAAVLLGSSEGFGKDSEDVRSVKPHDVRRLLLDNLGFDAPTISMKKLNPERLRTNQDAAKALDHTATTNKALSHKRRVRTFAGQSLVDCELTYYAAHTGRFSSRNSGRGLNLHNLPKRNPAIAKPVREMFAVPDDLCLVRGDFANVEYRVAGLLAGSQHVHTLFSANVLADPYSAFWTAATGQVITKKDPARQLAKAAVLGLGYGMGLARWTEELLRGIADPTFKVTLADLAAVCASQGWTVKDPKAKAVQTKLGAPWEVVAVAYHTREAFHAIHPEFMRLARWLESSVARLAGTTVPDNAINFCYAQPQAPDRGLIDLSVDDTLQGRSVRVQCGSWWTHPTVTWRDLMVRPTPMGAGLTFVRAGNRPVARCTINTLIENVVQSASRNALCAGMQMLHRRGYEYFLHVHDEMMLVVPRTRQHVLQARADLLKVFGPGGDLAVLGTSWAVLINPAEVTLSRTLYEDEKWAQAAWAALESGDSSPLENLP